MNLLAQGGKIISLRGLPNGRFAKRFGLSWWKRCLFDLVGRRLDKEAERRGASYEFLFVESNGAQLAEVARLIEQMGIKPSVDRVFRFDETNEALSKVAQGGSRGKVVISLE